MIDRSAAASDKYLLHVKIEKTDLIRTGYRSDMLLATSTIDLVLGYRKELELVHFKCQISRENDLRILKL